MTRGDVTSTGRARRLYVDTGLSEGCEIALARGQLHYVRDVIRLRNGDGLFVFNGRDGEWQGRVALSRREATIALLHRTRAQEPACDLHFLFAPLKHARLDYMVQKATELGVARLVPVITGRTGASRVNLARMRANAVEAAEQCGLVSVPVIGEPVELVSLIADWPAGRALVFADETAARQPDYGGLAALRGRPMALIVGPEGGFSPQERAALAGLAATMAISLGPRIMRADTAAVAALGLIQALAGDWTIADR
jgi:16S rRNA (uracil1498-N3)-methyltransferase